MRADTKPRVKFNRRLISDRLGLSHSHRHHHTGSNVVRLDTSLGALTTLTPTSTLPLPSPSPSTSLVDRCGVPLVQARSFRFRFSYFEVHRCVNRRRLSHIRQPMTTSSALPTTKLIPIPQVSAPAPSAPSPEPQPWSCADEFLQPTGSRQQAAATASPKTQR